MIVAYIILIVSFFLDGILTNFLPYEVGNLSFFTPLITIVALIVIYTFFYHKEKEYLLLAFITGLLYDLFYTNLLFLNSLIFLLIAFIIIKVYKVVGFNYLWILIDIVLAVILYESIVALLIVCFNLVPMSFDRLLYKITHTLVLNVIYGELLYLIVKLIPKKFRQVMIN